MRGFQFFSATDERKRQMKDDLIYRLRETAALLRRRRLGHHLRNVAEAIEVLEEMRPAEIIEGPGEVNFLGPESPPLDVPPLGAPYREDEAPAATAEASTDVEDNGEGYVPLEEVPSEQEDAE